MRLTESKLQQWARAFSTSCKAGDVIYLHGHLGAGKTTLSRYLIQALGWKGSVKSPTYTLVESYELPALIVHHFDLYRISTPQELYYIGIDEYYHAQSLVIVEWPEKGEGILPKPTIVIELTVYSATERELDIRFIRERT